MKPFPIITEFNDVMEFIDELSSDAGHVDTGIVRVTKQFRRHGTYPLQDVSVVATFIRDGRLVRLERYVGQVWPTDWVGEQAGNARVENRANEIIEQITNACNTLRLNVRPGVYKQEGASPCPG